MPLATSASTPAIEPRRSISAVPAERTRPFGCSVKWSDKRSWVKEGYEQWAQEPVALEPIDEAGVRVAPARERADLDREVDDERGAVLRQLRLPEDLEDDGERLARGLPRRLLELPGVLALVLLRREPAERPRRGRSGDAQVQSRVARGDDRLAHAEQTPEGFDGGQPHSRCSESRSTTSSRIRSMPRNPAWPSLVWNTSGSGDPVIRHASVTFGHA
mgnify:CR=1 FL=1